LNRRQGIYYSVRLLLMHSGNTWKARSHAFFSSAQTFLDSAELLLVGSCFLVIDDDRCRSGCSSRSRHLCGPQCLLVWFLTLGAHQAPSRCCLFRSMCRMHTECFRSQRYALQIALGMDMVLESGTAGHFGLLEGRVRSFRRSLILVDSPGW
jgi:hypothetical protein